MNTHRQLGVTTNAGAKATEKLSSGFRINRAGDDAAGLSISEKMRGQIRGLTQASRNAQDGISLIQTAEGALNETQAILQRMRELAVQSSSDTNVDELDREAIHNEFEQLKEEIDRIRNTTEFNTQKLLDGGTEGGETITVTEASSETVLGVDSQAVLKDTNDKIVAVQIDSAWYAIDDVEKDGENLVAVEDATALTLNEGFTIDGGGFYTQGTEEVLGVASQTVLKDADGEIVAVEINDGGDDHWYSIDDVKLDSGNIVLDGTPDPLNTDEIKVLEGSGGGTGGTFEATFQIGANKDQTMDISIEDMGSVALGIDEVSLATGPGAREAITTINDAINKVSTQRSELGAYQNRLEHTIKNLDNSAENLQAAESRIRDVDMAQEMMEFTKQNILQQASTAMLAQANMAPQSVLQLLR